MNALNIILIAIIWVAYGTFNAYQHDWHRIIKCCQYDIIVLNIIFAPFLLLIRIFRGVFIWNGKYED